MKNYSKEVLDALKRLPRYSKLLYKIFQTTGLKKSHRLMLYTAIGYIVSPIDLIPGVIPVIGQLDDILVVLTVIYKIIKAYKEDKFKHMLSDCDLTIDIVDKDIQAIKQYTKLVGISAVKIAGYGIKTIGKKGLQRLMR